MSIIDQSGAHRGRRAADSRELVALVVEDDASVVRLMRRSFPRDVQIEHVATKSDALERLRERRELDLALVDLHIGLERFAGLEVLAAMATARPTLTRALVTASCGPDVVNRATEHGAFFVAKPFRPAVLELLFERARMSSRSVERGPSDALERMAAEWRLPPKQKALVGLLAAGHSREDVARKLGIANNTFRAHVASILQRTGLSRIDEVVRKVVRQPSRPPASCEE
jgi:DNA-binding NarL/FixJ family response regulator